MIARQTIRSKARFSGRYRSERATTGTAASARRLTTIRQRGIGDQMGTQLDDVGRQLDRPADPDRDRRPTAAACRRARPGGRRSSGRRPGTWRSRRRRRPPRAGAPGAARRGARRPGRSVSGQQQVDVAVLGPDAIDPAQVRRDRRGARRRHPIPAAPGSRTIASGRSWRRARASSRWTILPAGLRSSDGATMPGRPDGRPAGRGRGRSPRRASGTATTAGRGSPVATAPADERRRRSPPRPRRSSVVAEERGLGQAERGGGRRPPGRRRPACRATAGTVEPTSSGSIRPRPKPT